MHKKTFTLLCALLISSAILGCGKKAPKEKIIATINKEPLYVKDFNRELALNIKRDPLFKITPDTLQSQLNMTIDRKLLIQEAKRQRLDETDLFVDTIKAFWEQTLIRDLIAHKDKEFENSVSVSEKEIKNYYEKLSGQATFKIVKHKDKDVLENLAKENPDNIKWEEEIGPINYEDVSSDVIFTAFNMPKGEKQVIRGRDFYYLIYVTEKEKVPVAPYEEMKPKIRERIKNFKKKKLFDLWFDDIRKRADVKINQDTLKNIKYSRE